MIKTQICEVKSVKEFLKKRKEGYGLPYIQCADELTNELYEYFKKIKKRNEEETLCFDVFRYRKHRDKYSSPFTVSMLSIAETQRDALEIWSIYNELYSLYSYNKSVEACSYLAWIALEYYPFKKDGKIELASDKEKAKKYASDCIERGYAYGYLIMSEIEGHRLN